MLDDQPVTYDLLKCETVTFESSSGSSQKFVKSYEYDEWGNVTVETQENGIRTVSEYYPPEGIIGKCPKHPYGMRAFLKTETIHASDDSERRVSTYTYHSIPTVGGGMAILPLTKVCGDMKQTYEYFDSSGPKTQGQLKSQSVTIGGKTTKNSCTYKFEDNQIHITDTTTGHDGEFATTKKTISHWTGLTKNETDPSTWCGDNFHS